MIIGYILMSIGVMFLILGVKVLYGKEEFVRTGICYDTRNGEIITTKRYYYE